MSTTDRMNELYEHEEAVISALQTLKEQDILENIIDHEVGIGVSKKIIGEETIKRLSEKQNKVLNEKILPKLQIKCDDCGCQIGYEGIPDAYEHSFEYGIVCYECRDMKMTMKAQMDD